jgi:hypothetical protein
MMENNGELILFPNDLPDHDYKELYRLTQEQIFKDFYPYSKVHQHVDTPTPEELRMLIFQLLTQIIQDSPSQLGAILYRVDISEKSARRHVAETNPQNSTQELSRLILRREAQKVWLRKSLS